MGDGANLPNFSCFSFHMCMCVLYMPMHFHMIMIMETRSGHKCLPQSRSTLLAEQDPSGVLLAVVEVVDLASLAGWLVQ